MRLILYPMLCCLLVTGCKKKDGHVCQCNDGSAMGELHKLGSGLSYDERQAACKQFQTLDSAGQVVKDCKIFVPI